MFNKISLICLLLAHLQIAVFAIETEGNQTNSWRRFFPSHRVMPQPLLIQPQRMPRPKLKEVKRCSFSSVFRTFFKSSRKMATDNSAISVSLSIIETMPSDVEDYSLIFIQKKRPYSQELRPKGIEFIPTSEVEIFQKQGKYFDGFRYTTDEELTFVANDFIHGNLLSCNIGKLGKFILNEDHDQFTEELPYNTSWSIKKSGSEIIGLAVRCYDEDDDLADEHLAVIHKTLLIRQKP